MKPLKYYLVKSKKEHWAIGQFNFSDFSQVKGIVQAAKNLKSPIILGTSEGESRFVGFEEAVAIRNVLRKKTGLPIFLNLDHGKSFEYLKKAILVGYDMVHFDGSKLKIEENIEISKKVVSFAKWRGVLVEGEIGRIGNDASAVYAEKFKIREEDLTNPDDAIDYLHDVRVDMLAISIGTFHGIDILGISPHLRIDRLKDIENDVKMPLVLHGGSGTPEEDLRESIQFGICKINVNTDLRLAFTKSLKAELEKSEITPYKYLIEPIRATQEVTEKYIKLFGSENKA